MGNKQPAFLEQRREQLETYLQELLIYFRNELPRTLAEFLDFNKYDIIYLLQDLAKLFHESGDALLSAKKEYSFSALEVGYSYENSVLLAFVIYLFYIVNSHIQLYFIIIFYNLTNHLFLGRCTTKHV